MKNIIIVGLIILNTLILFTGCARRAIPNDIAGKFYMAGDDKCITHKIVSDKRIMCLNADGQKTGYRDAMTDQELQMYMYKDGQRKAALMNLANQLNYNNQQMMNRMNNTYNFQNTSPYGF